MSLIVPAILKDTPEEFKLQLEEFLKIPNAQRFHIDISDGEFTSRRTIQLSEINVLNPAYSWEAHLMVKNPEKHFLDAQIAGFKTIIFHFEAVENKKKIAELVKELKKMKISAGLGIVPETEAEDILKYAELFDQILVLGVNPGYQGQGFNDSVYAKLEKLKNSLKNVKIEIDGAVKTANAKWLNDLGIDYLVVGSGMYENGMSPAQNYEKLQKEIKNL